eukprot:CAMPEP_0198141592 /NCGR_PEP_ID=MMETSP1443-20131203/4578_1 /TAXON_ID=186043 /ORGANISM="Entomoneis sp., Strain CCMP2396" /LENGTH=221 /DNA_ID=CAMNT_0043804391 /DNA_START=88 /DNA_END=753 /DNA_ORIENTATION=-
MYFPLFEYSLVVYLVLDYANTKLSYKRGEIPTWFFKWSQIVAVLSIILSIGFRMIFVYVAYEDPGKHTAGFLGLQFALVLVAVQNTLYVVMTGHSYRFACFNLDTARTARIAWTYLILNMCITSVKLYGTIFIVKHGYGPDLYKQPSFIPGKATGQIIDAVWMLFNAVIPLIIASVRMNNETPLEIEISLPTPIYVGESSSGKSGEAAPLTSGSAASSYNA